jgi:hypothetical protein
MLVPWGSISLQIPENPDYPNTRSHSSCCSWAPLVLRGCWYLLTFESGILHLQGPVCCDPVEVWDESMATYHAPGQGACHLLLGTSRCSGHYLTHGLTTSPLNDSNGSGWTGASIPLAVLLSAKPVPCCLPSSLPAPSFILYLWASNTQELHLHSAKVLPCVNLDDSLLFQTDPICFPSCKDLHGSLSIVLTYFSFLLYYWFL